MFIQTEATPNPQTLKFLPGVAVMTQGSTAFYTTAEAAGKESPLAAQLFSHEGIHAIFLGSDFITVTKSESSSWDTLKPLLLTSIMDHFVAGRPVMKGESASGGSSEADTELAKQIRELIETRVRPAVAQDGGDIVFRGFDEATGTVQLEMHGACSGCPSSTLTLKQGIENMLKHYVPEVQNVEAVPN
jgi:Fe-S cluster biogenesis protein NfuA